MQKKIRNKRNIFIFCVYQVHAKTSRRQALSFSRKSASHDPENLTFLVICQKYRNAFQIVIIQMTRTKVK